MKAFIRKKNDNNNYLFNFLYSLIEILWNLAVKHANVKWQRKEIRDKRNPKCRGKEDRDYTSTNQFEKKKMKIEWK